MTARVAAKQLAESGFQVTLYEREKLPRHKHCAGYVSPKSIRVLDSIGIDCRGTFDQTIRGMRIVCDGEDVEFNYTWAEDELPGNVCREHFDQLLVEHASASGVEIIDSTRVLGVSIPDDRGACVVTTKEGEFECEIVLGADGAGSVVRRDLGIIYPKSKIAATLEAEVPVGRDVLDSFNGKNYYDFGLFRSGYGWAFPKSRAGTVNVGVVVSVEDVVRMGRPMTGMFWDFLRGLDLYKDQVVQPHGSILPYQGTVDTLGREGVLLLGDAAGFVEPLGGEGIPYAIESGINAARAVKEHLEDGKPLLDSYEELMKDLLEEINVYGIRIHDNFYVKKNMMKAYFKIVKNNREMSDVMAEMMSRRMSYKEAMESLSPWRFFLAYIRTTLGL